MMSQVRNFSKVVLCAVLLMAAGCRDNDPFVDPGDTPNPNWVITVANDMTASMTAIVKVSFAHQAGTLAAFMGDDCCGIATYMDDCGLYNLYLSPATEQGGEVQLRFYSSDLKRIFVAKERFPFSSDGRLGTIAAPYTPQWTVGK